MKFQGSTTTYALAAFALTILLPSLPSAVQAIQVQYHLPKGTTECLYSPLLTNEIITTSIFINSGEVLKVRTTLQGPIAQYSISTSAEVLAAAMRLDKLGKEKKGLKLNRVEEIDFEILFNDDEILHDDDWNDDDHVNAKKTGGGKTDHGKEDDVMYQDYYYMDDDDEYEFMEDDAMDDVEIQEVRRSKAERDSMSSEQRKEKDAKKKDAKKKKIDEMKTARTEKSKRRVEEAKSKKEENRRKKREELQKMNEGKPAEKTFAISEEGWYRYCVEAAFAPVSVV